FSFPEILVVAPVVSQRLPHAPAKIVPSTSEKAGAPSGLSILLFLKPSRAPRGLSPTSQKCCAPVLPLARPFLRHGSVRPAPVSPASNTLAAATGSPNPVSRVSPAPGSPGIRASAAPPAGLAAPGPASSAPISSPPALPAWGSPYISVSSTCPEGSRRLPPRCLFSASALPSPVLFFALCGLWVFCVKFLLFPVQSVKAHAVSGILTSLLP